MNRITRSFATHVVGALVAMSAPAVANAQLVVTARSSIGGESSRAFTPRQFSSYLDILGPGDEARLVADALFEAYRAEHQAADAERSRRMREVFNEARESEDFSAVGDEVPRIQERYNEASRKLEDTLLRDVQAILTPEQASAWPRVERAIRRDREMPRGALSAESLDLIDLVGKLEVGASDELRQTLDAYEVEIDRLLQARAKAVEEQVAAMPRPTAAGGPLGLTLDGDTMEKMRELGAVVKDRRVAVRDANERFARKIEPLVSADVLPRYLDMVQRGSYPQVYSASFADRVLEAAASMDDLAADQRALLGEVRARHERESAAANDRWCRAIRHAEREDDDDGGSFIGPGGMMISMGMPDPEGPVAQARKDRRAVDKSAIDAVGELLSDEQRARLPSRDEFGGQVGGAQMIRIGG